MIVTRSNNACYLWCATIKASTASIDCIKEWCEEFCDKYVFQLEEGKKTKYMHYQCTFQLKVKMRRPEVPEQWEGQMSVASSNGETAIFTYAMKDDTRIDGPWSNLDSPSGYVQKRMKNATLRKWQQELIDRLDQQDDRMVMFVADSKGGAGKSFLRSYLQQVKGAIVIPELCTEVQQMAGFVISQVKRMPSKRWTIVLDIPRSLSLIKKQLFTLFALVESLKNGMVADGRNSARFATFEPPKLVVFYNNLPNGCVLGDFFSVDRIDLWNKFD